MYSVVEAVDPKQSCYVNIYGMLFFARDEKSWRYWKLLETLWLNEKRELTIYLLKVFKNWFFNKFSYFLSTVKEQISTQTFVKLMVSTSILILNISAVTIGMSLLWNTLRASRWSSRCLQIASNTLNQIVHSPQCLNWNLENLLPICRDLRKVQGGVLNAYLNRLSRSGERVGRNSWLARNAKSLGVICSILSAIACGYKFHLNISLSTRKLYSPLDRHKLQQQLLKSK